MSLLTVETTDAVLGICHKLIRLYTPLHNGKVERSHLEEQKTFYDAYSFLLKDFSSRLIRNYRRFDNLPMRSLRYLSSFEFLVSYAVKYI